MRMTHLILAILIAVGLLAFVMVVSQALSKIQIGDPIHILKAAR